MNRWNRRQFVGGLAGAWGAAATGRPAPDGLPAYLRGYETAFARDRRAAALSWFTGGARFGLFLHYNIKSLTGLGRKPTLGDFKAEAFDADALAELAVAAGMRYINFTAYHSGGPFLFRTRTSKATSLAAAAGRDLVAELAEACRRRSLGLFLYIHVSIVRTDPESLFVRNQTILRELLTQYGALAGVWFDSVLDYYRHPELYTRLREHYALVRSLQPQTLIAYKYGATGDEDFRAPENHPRDPDRNPKLTEIARTRIKHMPIEICTTLQLDRKGGTSSGMWFDRPDAYHRTADDVMALRADCRRLNANLLLNAGLRGDGSIHPADAATLREVGRRLA